MYGLVNKAIEGLVCSLAGQSAWEEIKRVAGVDVDYFVSMTPYPDEVSYKLVGAASQVLGLPAEEVLQKFGEYWILYTGQEGYGDLLLRSGRTLKEFLMNLDNLHAQVGMSFDKLQPPSFRCTEVSDNSLILHYYSDRAGLAPMVVGLLQGLGKMMNTQIEVTHKVNRAQGSEHDEFLVQYRSFKDEVT